MRVTQLFGLLALPLAACLPSTTGSQPSSSLRPRKIWASLAQFDFKPYVLSNACFDCARPETSSLFSCAIKCRSTGSADILEQPANMRA